MSPSAARRAVLARRLLRALEANGRRMGPLLILTHDNPDPDALASAWALGHLVQSLCRARVRIAYGGAIGRRENRIMAESLSIPAYPLRPSDLSAYPRTALVDAQPPFRNNRFPPRRKPDILVDHHPRHPETQASTLVIDEGVGATTTLMAEALLLSGVRIPKRLATAVVYGIGSETQNLGREACRRDADAYREFFGRADMRDLWRIANPRRPAAFFEVLARGIRDAFVCRRVIGVHLGVVPNPDRVAEMADFLLTHEGMRWAIVTGRCPGRLHVSLRTHDEAGGAGRLLKTLLRGRAGGHRMIAGGSIDMDENASERDWTETEASVSDAFLRSRGGDPEHRIYPFRRTT